MRARILTPYIGDGKTPATAYRPLVADLWPMSWTDVTGTPAANIDAGDQLQIVAECTPDVLAEIQNDARFTVLEVQS